MRVLFAGTPAVAIPTLRAILDSEHEVVGVLTRPPARAGRRRQLRPSPVHEFAETAGVPVITTDRPHQEDAINQLRALSPDLAAVVAYGALLREPALSLPRHGWINLHFSLLPAWRGAAPVQHAIRAGDRTSGASTFQIEAGLDTGPVFDTLTEPIRPEDTAGDLLERLAQAGSTLMVTTIDGIAAGSVEAQPQVSQGLSHAPRLTTADAQVDWSAPAEQIEPTIRAFTPAPGAWTTLMGARFKLGPVHLTAEAPALRPGQIDHRPGAVLVGTGTVPVRLRQLAPAGKGWMDALAWARGARDADGAYFGEGTQ